MLNIYGGVPTLVGVYIEAHLFIVLEVPEELVASHAQRQTEVDGLVGRRGARRQWRMLRGGEVVGSPRKALRFSRLHVIAKLEYLEPTSTVHKHRGSKGWGIERTSERS